MATNAPISIAMCTYNGERFIEEQLDSIAAQTVQPLELVVCDDGSTDRTVPLIEAFSRRAAFPVHVHVNAKNLGVTRNFESAAKRCTGKIILFTDQDDRWRTTKIQRIRQAFDADDRLQLFFSNAQLIDQSGKELNRRLWDDVFFHGAGKSEVMTGKLYAVLLRQSVVTGGTMAVTSDLIAACSPFNPNWVHDEWIAALAAAMDVRYLAEPQPLIDYRLHDKQQIGMASAGSFSNRVRSAPSVTSEKFELLSDKYQLLSDFIADRLSAKVAPRNIELLKWKIQSGRLRADVLRRSRLSRPIGALGLLLRGDYHRFWLGFMSFARDAAL